MLLLGMAAAVIVISRVSVIKGRSVEYKADIDKSTIGKVQSAVNIQGMGRHLLDFLK